MLIGIIIINVLRLCSCSEPVNCTRSVLASNIFLVGIFFYCDNPQLEALACK